jgi:protein phosphatase
VGDSRVYRYHLGKLIQVTEDHTWEEFALKHKIDNPHGKALRQAVGVGEAVEPETHHVQVASGDWLLVCSDGLYKMVDDAVLCAIFDRARSAAGACKDLIEHALRAGGKDNIAVCVARIDEAGAVPKPKVASTAPTSDPLLKVLIGIAFILLVLLIWQVTSK